jgi:hypothetical protein
MKHVSHFLFGVLVLILASLVFVVIPATQVPNFAAAKGVATLAMRDVRVFFAGLWASYEMRASGRAYAFQSAVALNQGFGVVGEIIFQGPLRAQPGVVKGTAANIVVGRAFTIDTADGQFSPGGTGVYGGILANPKAYASLGTLAGGPLAPTLVVPAGTACEFVTMGIMVVVLANAATIGDGVFFTNTTGVLSAGTAGAGQTQIAGAEVVRYSNAAPGLAVISLTA